MKTERDFELDKAGSSRGSRKREVRSRRLLRLSLWTAAVVLVLLGIAGWLGSKALAAKNELQEATQTLPALKASIDASDPEGAAIAVQALVQHTGAAREASSDPIWRIAAVLPFIVPNLEAASEVATSADDVARLGAVPLVK